MKKFATIFALLFVLSISAFAEGDIHTGGKSCPQGQVCFTNEGEYAASGKTEITVINNIFDYLRSIFG
jgi:hypothetical protein